MIVMLLCIEVGLRLPSLMAVVPPGLAVVNMVCTVYMMIERMVFVGLLGPPMLWLCYRVYVPFVTALFVKSQSHGDVSGRRALLSHTFPYRPPE